jgi:hypothetical protein
LYDFKQDEMVNIPSPFDFKAISVRSMFYDKKNNTAHIVVETVRHLRYYYVLGLGDYSWDEIEELGYPHSEIFNYYYDSFDEKIYYDEILSNVITIFDFQTREVVDRVKLFENKWYRIETFYGSPVRMLGQVQVGPDKDLCYLVVIYKV